MNEDDLGAVDRELSLLIAVDPSPEFVTSIRARIGESRRSPFAWRWWMGAAAIAAVVVIAMAMGGGRNTSAPQVPAIARADIRLAPRTTPARPTVIATSPRATRTRHPAQPDSTPEVLIDPAIAAAVRRLTTEQPVLPELPSEPSLVPVVVEPLKVPDIADAGTKQGSHP
jgi:hypothetical protein